MPQESALFSGDHVMAWSTSVVAPLDGAMRHYMASLEKLLARDEKIYWRASQGAATFCPRAPPASPRAGNRDPLPHRGLRLDDSIVANVYEGLDPALTNAAASSVRAHIEDLVERGLVGTEG